MCECFSSISISGMGLIGKKYLLNILFYLSWKIALQGVPNKFIIASDPLITFHLFLHPDLQYICESN